MRDTPRPRLAPMGVVLHGQRCPDAPCPCCNLPGGFCESHRARLAEIRVELGNEIKTLGQYAKRSDQRKKKRLPTCNATGCWEPRIPPKAFCAACEAAGWVEEE